MKIAQSTMGLQGLHAAVSSRSVRESLTIVQANGARSTRTGPADSTADSPRDQAVQIAGRQDRTSFSFRGQPRAVAAPARVADPIVEESAKPVDLLILQAFFEKLTGRKMQMLDLGDIFRNQAAAAAPAATGEPGAGSGSESSPSPAVQGGVRYERVETVQEYEYTQFSAQGLVRTSDGREIEIGLNVSMSRSFTSVLSERFQVGNVELKDPLMLDFTGTASQLTRRDWQFDIDADGADDQLAFVGPGAGFLALDKNGDGIINDGGELFGALSGNGFADLAQYDDDKNDWIDENDAIFARLRIWSRDDQGRDQLVALGVRGVGALYLGQVETPFSLKDEGNELLGQVRSSGLFLKENGEAGVMRQIDLVA